MNFVVDAFNGKADSILSRAKIDNFGKLKQQIVDAFHLVNFNGQAFRNARITDTYFSLRLKELKLACKLQEIRQRDIEEQRQIKEQNREEEKARREIEKNMGMGIAVLFIVDANIGAHTLVHKTARSAYSGGAWPGSKISVWATPPLRV